MTRPQLPPDRAFDRLEDALLDAHRQISALGDEGVDVARLRSALEDLATQVRTARDAWQASQETLLIPPA